MKRIKIDRRDFIKSSTFIASSAAGASLLVAPIPNWKPRNPMLPPGVSSAPPHWRSVHTAVSAVAQ